MPHLLPVKCIIIFIALRLILLLFFWLNLYCLSEASPRCWILMVYVHPKDRSRPIMELECHRHRNYPLDQYWSTYTENTTIQVWVPTKIWYFLLFNMMFNFFLHSIMPTQTIMPPVEHQKLYQALYPVPHSVYATEPSCRCRLGIPWHAIIPRSHCWLVCLDLAPQIGSLRLNRWIIDPLLVLHLLSLYPCLSNFPEFWIYHSLDQLEASSTKLK